MLRANVRVRVRVRVRMRVRMNVRLSWSVWVIVRVEGLLFRVSFRVRVRVG